jgi:signal transduction histidine kinase
MELEQALKRIRELELEIDQLRSKMAEMQEFEEQLFQARKMDSLANLAAGIAHDFNNILQSILGYTQLAILSEKETDPETFRQIEKIVGRGRQLTDVFLTFGRKRPPSFVPLDLNQKIRGAVHVLRRTIPNTIKIELDLSADLKNIDADGSQLDHMLINLCNNAKDAMPRGGRLALKTRNIRIAKNHPLVPGGKGEREYALLSVADTGFGIDPKDMMKIYEPFFSTKARGQGKGLGLAMVYAIVRDHGGFIECSSKVGEGTVFSLYFPALEATFRSAGQPLQEGAEKSFNDGARLEGTSFSLLR